MMAQPCPPEAFRRRLAQFMAGRVAGHEGHRMRISPDWQQGKGPMATLESWENGLKPQEVAQLCAMRFVRIMLFVILRVGA